MESAETERWELMKGTLLEGIQPDEGLLISTAAWLGAVHKLHLHKGGITWV